VGVPGAVASALAAKNQQVPTPISGWALLDTGASHTSIDEGAAVALSLQQINQMPLSTPHGTKDNPVFAVTLAFPGTKIAAIPFQAVFGLTLKNQGILALLGRDFLQGKTLHYDGVLSIVTLTF
jgi:predicted aspartyl protease